MLGSMNAEESDQSQNLLLAPAILFVESEGNIYTTRKASSWCKSWQSRAATGGIREICCTLRIGGSNRVLVAGITCKSSCQEMVSELTAYRLFPPHSIQRVPIKSII